MSIEALSSFTPTPRTTRNTPYEVMVYRTRTGDVVKRLPIVGTPRWERGVNFVGAWSVQVSLDQRLLSKKDLRQLVDPWYWSWAVVRGNAIHQAGPVVTEDYDDSGSNVTTVGGVGLWGLYKQKRVLVNATRPVLSVVRTIDADVSFGPGTTSPKGAPIPVANRNLSLHTIIKRLLENENAKDGGAGALPIVLPADIAGNESRAFLGPELAYTGNRIYELTQISNGPEVEFIAEFVNPERTSIRHRVSIGNPRLGQLGYAHSWTYGRALPRLGMISDGSRMRDRGWDRGSGYDRNLETGYAENLDGVSTGSFQTRPLLEMVGQDHNDEQIRQVLDDYAEADVARGRTTELNLSAEVTLEGDAGDGGSPPSPTFDAVTPGDTGFFNVYGHPVLVDGRYSIRVLRMSSASHPKRGTLTVEVLARP